MSSSLIHCRLQAADSRPRCNVRTCSSQISSLLRPKSLSASPISPTPKSESESNIQHPTRTCHLHSVLDLNWPSTRASVSRRIPCKYRRCSVRNPSPPLLSLSLPSPTRTQHPTRTCHLHSSSSTSTGHRLEHRSCDVLLANIIAAPSEIPLRLSRSFLLPSPNLNPTSNKNLSPPLIVLNLNWPSTRASALQRTPHNCLRYSVRNLSPSLLPSPNPSPISISISNAHPSPLPMLLYSR